MKFIILLIIILYSQIIFAQHEIRIRPAICMNGNTEHSDKYSGPAYNQYYSFRKVPLHFSGYLPTIFGIQIETNINLKTNIQLGITLRDNIGLGCNVSFLQEVLNANTGYKEIRRSFGQVYTGEFALRIPLIISYEIFSTKKNQFYDSIQKKNKLYFNIDLFGGISYLRLLNHTNNLPEYFAGSDGGTNLNGDSIKEEYYYTSFHKNSITFIGGLSLKLKNKKREIICLSLSYEQGIRNIAYLTSSIYIGNMHFSEYVYSRGSRFLLSLSCPITIFKL